MGILVLVAVIHHFQLKAAVEKYRAELKAQGEPMELAQVIPPAVPPGQNSAPLITNALCQIRLENNHTKSIDLYNNPPWGMNRSIPGKIMIGWHQPIIHGPNTYPRNLTNTWEDLAAQLADRSNDLNDFRKLVENPRFDFNDDEYSDSYNFAPALLSRLSQMKVAVLWLEASVFYNLHQGRTADACTDVRAMLAFVKGETGERYEISQLVGFAFASMCVDSTWNLLQTTDVTDEDLAQLQQDWQSLEFIAPMRNAFLFERVTALQQQNTFRQSPTNLDAQIEWTKGSAEYHYNRTANGDFVLVDKRSLFRKVTDVISARWNKFQWRWYLSYTDEIRGLQMWGAVIDGTQMLATNRSLQAVHSLLKTYSSRPDFDSVRTNPYAIMFQIASDQLSAIRKLARIEVARNVVIVAIALKRYELRRHQLPATLEELTPDLLKSVPIDFMNGQPLRYRRNADGTFLLYSVGENGKDDGGDPSFKLDGITRSSYLWQHSNARDWVWPQPATEMEIQNYFGARLPKAD